MSGRWRPGGASFDFAFGGHVRQEILLTKVQFPLTRFAGAPRDEFTFRLIFDLYDRTAPQSPTATAPELRGACEGSLFAYCLC